MGNLFWPKLGDIWLCTRQSVSFLQCGASSQLWTWCAMHCVSNTQRFQSSGQHWSFLSNQWAANKASVNTQCRRQPRQQDGQWLLLIHRANWGPQNGQHPKMTATKRFAPNEPLSTEVQQLRQPIGYLDFIREVNGGPPVISSILYSIGDRPNLLEQCTWIFPQGEEMQVHQGACTQGQCYGWIYRQHSWLHQQRGSVLQGSTPRG